MVCFAVVLCFLGAGCTTLHLPDNWQEEQERHEKEQQEEEQRKREEANRPTVLTSFSFLKEDNPKLKQDIICRYLDSKSLVMVPEGEIELPCKLIARFDVSNGSLVYNGDTLKDGKGEIYCSLQQSAQIKLVGPKKTVYQNVQFVPNTGLPYVLVYTDNKKDITSKTAWEKGIMITHGLGQIPDAVDTVYVRKRGNGTAKFPKISFNVKHLKRRSVLGMPKHKKWCFLANYRDRTLIRNDVAFFLGEIFDGLEWTPHFKYAEVLINGSHQGVYQVAEQIKIDKNRININEMAAADTTMPNISGGYLLELDSYYDETFKFKTPIEAWPMNIKGPDDDICSPAQVNYISGVFAEIESLLAQGKYQEVYSDFIDLDSFVDYYLVQTLTNNKEFAAKHSVFCYKKRNGKVFAGPLWDFEYSTFNSGTGVSNTSAIWYKYLFKDAYFVNAVKNRWNAKKGEVEEKVFSHIAQQQALLTVSAHIDETIIPKGQNSVKNGDEHLSFEESIGVMVDILHRRIAYMDSMINSLR